MKATEKETFIETCKKDFFLLSAFKKVVECIFA